MTLARSSFSTWICCSSFDETEGIGPGIFNIERALAPGAHDHVAARHPVNQCAATGSRRFAVASKIDILIRMLSGSAVTAARLALRFACSGKWH